MPATHNVIKGMLTASALIIFVGLSMLVYGYLHRDGTTVQQAHIPAGIAVILMGALIGITPFLSVDVLCGALVVGFIFMVGIYHISKNIQIKRRMDAARQRQRENARKD
ncbi:MAG: hypothetical protein K6G10_13605 [Butyrivibrio sp.]|nr:hypothetical protein [Butyrivibrio sp.]